MKSSRMICLAVLAMLAVSVNAETVHLKDGSILNGIIKRADADIVEIETQDGVLQIKKERIQNIDYAVAKDTMATQVETPIVEESAPRCEKGMTWRYDRCYPENPILGTPSSPPVEREKIEERKKIDPAKIDHPGQSGSREFRFYGALDIMLPGNAGDGLWDDAQLGMQQVSGLGYSSVGSIETGAAIGGRIGLNTKITERFDIGGSFGYIAGPNSEVNVTVAGGGKTGILSDDRKLNFIRFLVGPTINIELSENSGLHLGTGLGIARGSVKETLTCVGTACISNGSANTVSSSWTGFTWEISPSYSINKGIFGMRIAGFPKLNGTSGGNSMIEWTSVGFFGGFVF